MHIENNTALLYVAPPAAVLTPETPPPSCGGPALMDGTIHPAVDTLLQRNFQEFAHVCVARSDYSAFILVINGMIEGYYVKRLRCFPMYGEHAPKTSVMPLNISNGIELCEESPIALPHRNIAYLITVSTDDQTLPGKYRTSIEVEGEAGVTYVPVVIDVGDADLVEITTTPLVTPLENPLDILYTAASASPFAFYDSEDYRGILYRVALHNRKLYQTALDRDPTLTNALLSSLRSVSSPVEDDALLFQKLRKTLLYRLDDRFRQGNREPLKGCDC